MLKSVSLVLVLISLVEVQSYQSRKASYDGFTVFRVTIRDVEDARIVSRLKRIEGFDFWSHIDLQNHRVDIMVAPDKKEDFMRFMLHNGLDWIVIIEDVEKLSELLGHLSDRQNSATVRNSVGSSNVSQYMSYDQIRKYAESLVNLTNPENEENIAVLEVVGKSYLGRDVIMIKISSDHVKQKPIVFLEAGMHAREWAGPPTVLYLIQQLVENFAANKEMLDNVDFYVIPVTNPDGYEHTRNHDRMWRKTRSGHGKCIGVDGNRNFDYFWGVTGASPEPCSDTYKGPKPFSEMESQNIRNVALKYRKRLLGYVAVHSYGGYLLYPWGYTKELPDDWEQLDKCATNFADAVAKYSGTKYVHGTSARVLYEAAGGSDDYMKGKLNVPFAYTLEVAGPQEEGFNLNPRSLPTLGAETFEGFKALAECFYNYYELDTKTSETMRARSGWFTG